MPDVLGFEFYQGPEVPPPLPIDFTMDPLTVHKRRKAWAALLEDQIRYHDAWGILTVDPSTDVFLFDVHNDSAYQATAWGGTAYLLLAKEARRDELTTAVTANPALHVAPEIERLQSEVERLGGDYFSTYCIHGEHSQCRLTCKICDASCQCNCHP